jgi:DNA-binding response OmpR family regulator
MGVGGQESGYAYERDAQHDEVLGRGRWVSVFLGEGDAELRAAVAARLRAEGYLVLEAADASGLSHQLEDAFLSGGASTTNAVVIVDVKLPGRDGLALLRQLRAHAWCPPILLVGDFSDDFTPDEARDAGAAFVLRKPFTLASLCTAVAQIAPGA